jgi:DNA-binding transcriptional MerR regulator
MSNAAERDTEGRRVRKSPSAFRTISEVASELDVPQHVLRFWESKFSQIKPMKRGGGRRYYRPEDVALLERIRTLLYNDGYTIKGVQKLLREASGRKSSANGADAAHSDTEANSAGNSAADAESIAAGNNSGGPDISALKRRDLQAVVDELEALQELLKRRKR